MTSLKSIDYRIDFTKEEKCVELFLFDMPNLIEVTIKGSHIWKAIDNCVSRCQNIKILTLCNSGYECRNLDPLLRNIATNMRQLRSLSLENGLHNLSDTGIGYLTGCIVSGTQKASNVNQQLKTLILSCSIKDQGLQYISSGLHSLRKLQISSVYITNKGVGYLANMKCLKELGLHYCYRLNDECLKLLSDGGSKITHLRVEACREGQFGDKTLEYIGQSQLPVEELFVSRWSITDKGFRHFVKYGQNIKHLTLLSCCTITDKSLELIADKLTSLRFLKVKWCFNTTQQGIKNVKKLRRNLKVVSLYYC